MLTDHLQMTERNIFFFLSSTIWIQFIRVMSASDCLHSVFTNSNYTSTSCWTYKNSILTSNRRIFSFTLVFYAVSMFQQMNSVMASPSSLCICIPGFRHKSDWKGNICAPSLEELRCVVKRTRRCIIIPFHPGPFISAIFKKNKPHCENLVLKLIVN